MTLVERLDEEGMKGRRWAFEAKHEILDLKAEITRLTAALAEEIKASMAMTEEWLKVKAALAATTEALVAMQRRLDTQREESAKLRSALAAGQTLQRLLDDAGNERQVWFDRWEKAEAALTTVNEEVLKATLQNVTAVKYVDWLTQECRKAIRAYVAALGDKP